MRLSVLAEAVPEGFSEDRSAEMLTQLCEGCKEGRILTTELGKAYIGKETTRNSCDALLNSVMCDEGTK